MSGELRRLTTEEQHERLYLARKRGGLCAACGKTLSADETVYVEEFVVGVHRLVESTAVRRSVITWAPVGVECASLELLDRVAAREPERCAGCGRGMHYRVTRSTRQRALCSIRCRYRASAKQPNAEG